MESYISDKKKLYSILIEFFENDNENNEEISKKYFQQLSNIMMSQQIEGDHDEIEQFLQMIKCISDNHHRNFNFLEKILHILIYISLI